MRGHDVSKEARAKLRIIIKEQAGRTKEQVGERLILSFKVSRFKQTGADHSLLLVRLLDLGGGAQVLLVLGDEVVHVGLGRDELHLVHSLTAVPLEGFLAAEQAGELLADTLRHLLGGGEVAEEVDGHFVASGGCHSRRT